MKKIQNYFQGVWTELHKVSFPGRKETLEMTNLVITLSIAIAVFVSTFDFVFRGLIKWLIAN